MHLMSVARGRPTPPGAETGTGSPSAATAQADARLRELFRLWLRDGHVHPLIHLMRRYRSGAQ
jgi:hypothetical protein